MAEVADAMRRKTRQQFHFDGGRVDWLEAQIDELKKEVKMPKEFIVPEISMLALTLSLAVGRRPPVGTPGG